MTHKKPVVQEPWSLTQDDIDALTDKEYNGSTTRCLPPLEEIPVDFMVGNIYTQIAEAIRFGERIPAGEVVWQPGFKPDSVSMVRFLLAHLRAVKTVFGNWYPLNPDETVVPLPT